jgi:hypothetical protein
METGEAYQELRPLLFSIAYRMVGSVSEAEDIMQESFLRFHRAVREGTQVESPKAYLSAVTTRLGRLLGALCVDIADGQVQTVRSIVNPDKLRHLGPVTDG